MRTDKEKCQWLSEFYAKAAKGGAIQLSQLTGSVPEEWQDAIGGPAMDSNPDRWRVTPGEWEKDCPICKVEELRAELQAMKDWIAQVPTL